jgi:hypothetical protein
VDIYNTLNGSWSMQLSLSTSWSCIKKHFTHSFQSKHCTSQNLCISLSFISIQSIKILSHYWYRFCLWNVWLIELKWNLNFE